MTEETFYKSDNHRYELSKNKNYVEWFKYLKKQGYVPLLTIEELQELINHIASWYENKYPDKDFDIPYESSISLLLCSLSRKENRLLNGNYRGFGFQKINNENIFSLSVYYLTYGNIENPSAIIRYKDNGELINNKLLFDNFNDKELEIAINENIKDIKSLYQELSKYKKELDLHELEETVYNNYCDSLVRKYTLRLVALKLLYSPNTTSYNGYIRACKFVNDFSSYFASKDIKIDLTTNEIDIIINNCVKEREKVLKK